MAAREPTVEYPEIGYIVRPTTNNKSISGITAIACNATPRIEKAYKSIIAPKDAVLTWIIGKNIVTVPPGEKEGFSSPVAE